MRDELRAKGEIDENDNFREFSYMEEHEMMEKDPTKTYYKGHNFVKFLERGSIFGLKTLKKYAFKKTDKGFKVNNTYTKHAKLSIVAETSKVIIYTFNINNFKYLTEDIQVRYLSGNSLIILENFVGSLKHYYRL